MYFQLRTENYDLFFSNRWVWYFSGIFLKKFALAVAMNSSAPLIKHQMCCVTSAHAKIISPSNLSSS